MNKPLREYIIHTIHAWKRTTRLLDSNMNDPSKRRKRRRRRLLKVALEPQLSLRENVRLVGVPTLADSDIRLEVPSITQSFAMRKPSQILPTILFQREIGSFRKQLMFSRCMLTSKATPHTNGNAVITWRPYALRQIPFTALETPAMDALLGLTRNGSYGVSLGGPFVLSHDEQHCGGEKPIYALRFYGIPGRSMWQKRNVNFSRSNRHTLMTPRIQTVPLLYASDVSENEDDYESLVCTCPTFIWLSTEESIGVVLLKVSQTNDTCLVIFEQPRAVAQGKQITCILRQNLRATNFDIGQTVFLAQSYLFRVCEIPVSKTQSALVEASLKTPAHVFVWHQGSKLFKLTWVFTLFTVDFHQSHKVTTSNEFPFACPGLIKSTRERWETEHYDSRTGAYVDKKDCLQATLAVASDIQLDIEKLENDLRQRRQKIFIQEQYVQFHCSWIGLVSNGRTAQIVNAFGSTNSKGLAVFVEIDLWTSSYRECEWKQHRITSDLGTWCDSLAFQYRLRLCRLGPYRFEEKLGPYKVKIRRSNDLDGYYSRNDDEVSYSKLYPDCETFHNKTVIAQQPSPIMSCQAPIQLIYG